VCLFCAFNVTFKALQDFRGQIQPASIIFVTGSETKPDKFDILASLFDNARVQIFTLAYPGTRTFPELVQLSLPNARHYSIHDDPSSLYTFSSLTEIFADILAQVEHVSFPKIHLQFYEGAEIIGTFTVREEMKANLFVSLIIDAVDKIEFFELKSPSGQTEMFPTFMDGFVQFDMSSRSPEAGLWTYKARLYKDYLSVTPKSIVQAFATESDPKSISLDCFPGHYLYENPSSPPKIYCRLFSGSKPVLHAKVIVIITR
jgi:hypothetical protein